MNKKYVGYIVYAEYIDVFGCYHLHGSYCCREDSSVFDTDEFVGKVSPTYEEALASFWRTYKSIPFMEYFCNKILNIKVRLATDFDVQVFGKEGWS